jgi:hypothetical protein
MQTIRLRVVGATSALVALCAVGYWSLAAPSLIERSNRPASRIFEGFAYAGERPVGPTWDVAHASSTSPVPLSTLHLPARFLPGREYLFHHLSLADSNRIAEEVLAPRLRNNGFTIPAGMGGIFSSFAVFCDGPYREDVSWTIRFGRNRCNGTIGHHLDIGLARNRWPWIRARWENSDYILTLKGECDL